MIGGGGRGVQGLSQRTTQINKTWLHANKSTQSSLGMFKRVDCRPEPLRNFFWSDGVDIYQELPSFQLVVEPRKGEGERERERWAYVYIYLHMNMYIHMCVYTNIM